MAWLAHHEEIVVISYLLVAAFTAGIAFTRISINGDDEQLAAVTALGCLLWPLLWCVFAGRVVARRFQ